MPSAEQDNTKITQSQQWTLWAEQSQCGDKASYNKLLRDILPFIRNVLVGGLANPDWADDITQEVLVSVHKSLKTYSPDKPFRPWLMAIINFRRTDYLRKHYNSRQDKQTSLDNPEFITSHVTKDGYAGELKDMEQALQSLQDKPRRIFTMMKIEGYTAKEVANELGMSESAVKVSAHRAAQKLQKILGK